MKTNLDKNGLRIPSQDLSLVAPSSDDDGRLYNHDGGSSISLVDGGSSSEKGFFMWDESASAWNPLKLTLASIPDGTSTDGSFSVSTDLTVGDDAFIGDVTIENPASGNPDINLDGNGTISRFGVEQMSFFSDRVQFSTDIDLSGTLTAGGFTLDGSRGLFSDTQFAALETYGTGDGSWEFYDKANAQPILSAKEGGEVEIPNGNLNLAGVNNIVGVSLIKGRGDADSQLQTEGASWRIRDSTNALDIARFNEGGEVEIPNGNLDIGTNDILLDHSNGTGSQIQIANAGASTAGSIAVELSESEYGHFFNINSIDGNDEILWGADFSNDYAFQVYNKNGWNNLFAVERNGNVRIPKGDLNLFGNSIDCADLTASGKVTGNSLESGSNLNFDDNGSIQRFGANYMTLYGNPNRIAFHGTNVYGVGTFNADGTSTFGGSVDITGGNLDLGTNSILSLGLIVGEGGQDINFWATGTIAFSDSAGTQTLLLKDGGNAEVPNGDLHVSGDLTADGSVEGAVEHVSLTASGGQRVDTAGDINWDTQHNAPTAAFSHSTSTNPDQITVNEAGTYRISTNIGIYRTDGVNIRSNIGVELRVNGVAVPGQMRSFYIREQDDHDDGSGSMTAIENLSAGDVITVYSVGETTTGGENVYLDGSASRVDIEKIGA